MIIHIVGVEYLSTQKTDIYANSNVCINKNGDLAKNLICPVLVELQPEGTLPDLESLNEALSFLRNVAWNPWTDIRERDDIKKLNVPFPYGPLPDEIIKDIIQSYNAAVSYIDDLTGKLLKEVKNDTLIVFTGDHGWSLGEHGEFAKYSNFEESTRVPLLIHVPGLSNRKVVSNKLVELVDIFPTLVELTQISSPLPLCPNHTTTLVCTEGLSLVPVMIDEIQNKDIKIMGYSMKTKRYRYAEWVKFNPKNFTIDWTTRYGRELYDHLLDPKENMNLSDRPELNAVIKKLRNKLILGWRHEIKKKLSLNK
ncbi:hypothetical protein NQ314_015678 [Rhamnusium bicolor]|uniref:Sulfatase N-terminal domain-containing protein n=1 Tax=Rhamnusium bicolor TaxID=1586634 RepID=A0AAV8X0K2_9CUCU|nr:hypothetical protein NQ314_015678 [Rhamnusium bicolor]